MTTTPKQCAICFKENNLTKHEEHENYSLWECGSCDAQFWFPLEHPGKDWYEKDERSQAKAQDPYRALGPNHRAFLKEHNGKGKTLLDVGCGIGNFIASAQKQGWEVWGIDLDEYSVQTAKQFFELERVFVATLEEFIKANPNIKFDAITFFEVLEHLDNPREFIKQVYSLLNPGGIIAFSVPYRNAWKPFLQHDYPPRHLTRWNERALENLLAAQGFSQTKVRQMAVPFSFLVGKLHNWSQGYLSFGLVGKARQKLQGRASPAQRDERGVRLRRTTAGLQGGKAIIYTLKILAVVKGWLLFTIPTFFILVYLRLIRKPYLGLYARAVKTR